MTLDFENLLLRADPDMQSCDCSECTALVSQYWHPELVRLDKIR